MSRLTTYKRRRPSKKRPVYRKRRYMRKKRSLGQRSFKVLRWSSADSTNNCHIQIAGSDAVPSVDSTTQFSLSNVNGYAELVSLFDNFRILKVMYRWVITRNPDQATTTANKGIYPRIVWTHDFNDSTTISRNQIYQRANLKEFYFGDSKQVSPWYTLNPASLAVGYEGPAASTYTPVWRRWMDTNDSAAPHYGIKYSIDNFYLGVNMRMEAKVCVECKGVS